MTVIFVLRHGDYQNNIGVIPFRLSGFPLNAVGINQARLAADFLTDKNIKQIYCSPVLRCRQTALIVGEKLKLIPKTSSLITETKSPYQGMNLDKFRFKETPTFFHRFHLKNHGEDLEAVSARGMQLIKLVLKKYSKKNVLLVTHGDVIMAMIYCLVDKNIKARILKRRYIPRGGLIKFSFKENNLIDFQEFKKFDDSNHRTNLFFL